MSAAVEAQAERLDALTVIGLARDAAGNGGPRSGRQLIVVLQSCRSPQAVLQAACDALLRNPDAGHQSVMPHDPGPQPWPLPEAVLLGRLLNLIGDALSRDPSQAIGWACFRAVQHGVWWLMDAERLALRDGHLMRQRGGQRLPPAVFDGAHLRAEITPTDAGDVLRLTWEDSGRLVAQSFPGRFGDLDESVNPE